MLIKKFIIGILSFYAIDIKRHSKSLNFTPFCEVQIERAFETRKKKETERKKTRLYDKRKWKKKKQYYEKNFNLLGTNPKDLRFSNQQKLRRMYRST